MPGIALGTEPTIEVVRLGGGADGSEARPGMTPRSDARR